MSYILCGLIVGESDVASCVAAKLPFVRLRGGLLLIPIDRDYTLLVDGDETEPGDLRPRDLPDWLSQMASQFPQAAYVEACAWGGAGMQACCFWREGRVVTGPSVSSAAINVALHELGVAAPAGLTVLGSSAGASKDLFEVVGLDRHASTEDWLSEATVSNNNET